MAGANCSCRRAKEYIMKLISFTFAFIFMVSQAFACIPNGFNDGLAYHVDRDGGFAEFRYSDLRNGADVLREEQLREALQAFTDNRVVRERLDGDDPDRSINPDTPNEYWSDADGVPVDSIFDATHVTFRCVIVTNVHWDGTDFIISWSSVQ